ncbi:SDR family oxidoreductase [Kibdelosporangium phytohabitans]|uniref:Short-chain dehydrogenase n=1 Tax=Kibdelosporangium phytohabitans TaxID=860235 RepID=A0A0N9I691_9PSEU|nr:SDR family oxidoreductase [Kibdelosporangium phytohabitans]ALG15617.1 short-chain dehydrogenase [Kibdelosporangium phytohabitans]MBE1465481.1 NADP-dependent 3-hydroxy acid dehydrogenase YdfG [Kibdelosporangium phytohabitans]
MTYENLAGRTAVVTGAASGIGAAVATALADNGARVALLARRSDRIEELAATLNANGGQAIAVTADVTSDASVTGAAERIHSVFDRVDLVVNNAGVMIPEPIDTASTGNWQRMIDTNVTGVLRVLRAFTPDLTADGHADLVNISSIGAHEYFKDYAVYGATKAAVTYLSRSLRAELGPAGVRVTNIEPGLVRSELRDDITGDAAAFLDDWIAEAGILAAEDLADVVAYVTSRPAHVNLRQLVALPATQF